MFQLGKGLFCCNLIKLCPHYIKMVTLPCFSSKMKLGKEIQPTYVRSSDQKKRQKWCISTHQCQVLKEEFFQDIDPEKKLSFFKNVREIWLSMEFQDMLTNYIIGFFAENNSHYNHRRQWHCRKKDLLFS